MCPVRRKKLNTEPPAPGGLAGEIGKRRPFEMAEQEVHLNLVRTHWVVAAEFEKLFKGLGLSEATYNLLRILRGAGECGRACSEVGRDMVARVPDVTRLVDRLEKMGMVERQRVEHDRRVVQVKITAAGLAALARLDGPTQELHRSLLGHMTKAEMAELSRLLVKARGAACPTEKGADVTGLGEE